MNSGGSGPKQHEAERVAASASRRRKGRLAESIIAISSAAVISIYTLGRAHTSAAYDQLTADPPGAAAAAAPVAPSGPGVATAPTGASSAPNGQASPTATAAYKDGTYTGSGNSRHGGMQVTVVIKDGKITSANVTSCSTRYPCSDVNPLMRAAVSRQSVPANHVSGATDSSQAYRQAFTNALKQARA